VEPAAAGPLHGRHVSTIEDLFHFLHQLAAIICLGGILAINVVGETGDQTDQESRSADPEPRLA
jgi:hypothetical protein